MMSSLIIPSFKRKKKNPKSWQRNRENRKIKIVVVRNKVKDIVFSTMLRTLYKTPMMNIEQKSHYKKM